jgi:hypothetical protein
MSFFLCGKAIYIGGKELDKKCDWDLVAVDFAKSGSESLLGSGNTSNIVIEAKALPKQREERQR